MVILICSLLIFSQGGGEKISRHTSGGGENFFWYLVRGGGKKNQSNYRKSAGGQPNFHCQLPNVQVISKSKSNLATAIDVLDPLQSYIYMTNNFIIQSVLNPILQHFHNSSCGAGFYDFVYAFVKFASIHICNITFFNCSLQRMVSTQFLNGPSIIYTLILKTRDQKGIHFELSFYSIFHQMIRYEYNDSILPTR